MSLDRETTYRLARVKLISKLFGILVIGVVLLIAIGIMAYHLKVVKEKNACYLRVMSEIKATDTDFYTYLAKAGLESPVRSPLWRKGEKLERSLSIIERTFPLTEISKSTEDLRELATKIDVCNTSAQIRISNRIKKAIAE